MVSNRWWLDTNTGTTGLRDAAPAPDPAPAPAPAATAVPTIACAPAAVAMV